MSAQSWAVRWVVALAALEAAVTEGERLVEEGRVEEFRTVPVPVVATGLPPELADRARNLQDRLAALTERVAEAMTVTLREIEAAATERADRGGRNDRGPRAVRRQWQPSYVDARA
ncbi:hypothetical protein ABEG17_09680 [Pedococcus sp. KACC 23699]|uniref:Uncharacterized protein n=1 Tax=Pedococcus sp. KACC 23699 TaxID=3149228 RepID=A0AAU7JZ74_9MICO